jgi:signal transduction histidine kinase
VAELFAYDIAHLGYFFIGHVVAFTICILMFGERNRSTDTWVISNILGIVGMAGFAYTGPNVVWMSAMGASVIVFSGAVKALAFTSGRLTNKRYRWGNVVVLLNVICAALIVTFPDLPYRRLVFLLGLVFASIASLIYLGRDRRWAGLKQAKYVFAVFVVGIFLTLVVIAKTALLPADFKIVNHSSAGIANFLQLCLASMGFQLVFLTLIFGLNRQARERAYYRNARLKESIALKKAIYNETATLSNERENLIKMLTHEVRQPLNTAQAALQSITADVAMLEFQSPSIKSKLDNMVNVLNSITLSISNSLLGATLISSRRKAERTSVNVCDVSQLAYLDLNASDQTRVDLQFEQPYIYADADPIVLRLALRNLLENAVKYSPADTPVVFKIRTDENSLMLQFSVKNQIIHKGMLDGDIFGRNKRGIDNRYRGDGLGLFIVNEVAAMHEGTSRFDVDGDEVTFYFEIPA